MSNSKFAQTLESFRSLGWRIIEVPQLVEFYQYLAARKCDCGNKACSGTIWFSICLDQDDDKNVAIFDLGAVKGTDAATERAIKARSHVATLMVAMQKGRI